MFAALLLECKQSKYHQTLKALYAYIPIQNLIRKENATASARLLLLIIVWIFTKRLQMSLAIVAKNLIFHE